MSYLEFKNKMYDLACFNIDQIYGWQPGFNRNNLYRWVKSGLLIRLKQGYFSFPEYISKPDFAYYFANRIYRPSYVSLHTALAFYGIIPEAVVQICSVTSLKTASFVNPVGEYSYKSIKPDLMFGYEQKPISGEKMLNIARPEKALLDLLYLYPEYNSVEEMAYLRLDEDYMVEELNVDLLQHYLKNFANKALESRVKQLTKAYNI